MSVYTLYKLNLACHTLEWNNTPRTSNQFVYVLELKHQICNRFLWVVEVMPCEIRTNLLYIFFLRCYTCRCNVRRRWLFYKHVHLDKCKHHVAYICVFHKSRDRRSSCKNCSVHVLLRTSRQNNNNKTLTTASFDCENRFNTENCFDANSLNQNGTRDLSQVNVTTCTFESRMKTFFSYIWNTNM